MFTKKNIIALIISGLLLACNTKTDPILATKFSGLKKSDFVESLVKKNFLEEVISENEFYI
jgi:uncharacterized protein YceH (UPF0502 family)